MAWYETDVFSSCGCGWKKIVICAAAFLFLGGVIVVLVLAFAVVHPPKATADDAVLQRFALAPGSPAENSTISYNLTTRLSLKNPNMYRGIVYEPMSVEVSFNGTRFDESAKKVPALADHKAGKTSTFHVTMGGVSRPIRLTAAGVRDFAAENVTGKFDVELRLDTALRYKGRKARCPVAVICPLKLQLVDPEVAVTAYQKTKCTVLRAKKSGC